MAILRRKSGYQVLVDDVPGLSGRRKRVTIGTFERKRDAEAAQRAALLKRDQGIAIAKAPLTLDALFDKFMSDAVGRNLSGTTLSDYRSKWTLYVSPRIGGALVSKIKPIDLSDLYTDLRREGGDKGRPLSVRSVQHVATLIRTVLGWAYRLELIPRNITDFVSSPRGSRKRAVPYQQHEAEALIAMGMRGRVGPVIVFAFHTGLRRGELCGLKWTDIDEARKVAVIRGSIGQITKARAAELGQPNTWAKSTKGDTQRPISLSDVALEALRFRRLIELEERRACGPSYKDDGYVFAPPKGGYTTPGGLSNAVRRVAIRAGLLTTSLHATRHSTASFLLSEGVPIATVSALLRHSSQSTTLGAYSHVLDGAQTDAVERLARRFKVIDGSKLEARDPQTNEKAV